MAFNAKNLHYDKNEPAFLRKLRDQHGGSRETFQAARPKRDRLTNDDDDGPAMVDEEGESVSKEDYEAMISTKDEEGKVRDVSDQVGGEGALDKGSMKDGEVAEEVPKEKQKVADVGVAKKRKQVKVVGEDEGEEPEVEKKVKMTKKSKKKVKLSFDESEG